MSVSGWIGVDLDGTLARYDGWRGIDHIGEPIPAMVERVKRWLADGVEVRIFTARISGCSDEQRRDVETPIARWCATHIGRPLPITCAKDLAMVELWDDRAVQVEVNTGRIHPPFSPPETTKEKSRRTMERSLVSRSRNR